MPTIDALSLANGFLLGEDDGFSKAFKELVKKTGVTHLVAASGANLVFLEMILGPLVFHLSANQKKVFFSLTTVLYFLLVGESGSLWRATVMWFVTWGGLWLGRRTSLVIVLFQTVILTFLLRPDWLESASFWLSWLAMTGVYFSHLVRFREKDYCFFPKKRAVSNYLNVSLLTGWWVLAWVSLWLWTQYGVFQPHGIVVTMGIEPLIPLYMILAAQWKTAGLVCSGLQMAWCSWWRVFSVRSIELVFLPINWWLQTWAYLLNYRWFQISVQSCLIMIGAILCMRSVRESLEYKYQRAERWMRLAKKNRVKKKS